MENELMVDGWWILEKCRIDEGKIEVVNPDERILEDETCGGLLMPPGETEMTVEEAWEDAGFQLECDPPPEENIPLVLFTKMTDGTYVQRPFTTVVEDGVLKVKRS